MNRRSANPLVVKAGEGITGCSAECGAWALAELDVTTRDDSYSAVLHMAAMGCARVCSLKITQGDLDDVRYYSGGIELSREAVISSIVSQAEDDVGTHLQGLIELQAPEQPSL